MPFSLLFFAVSALAVVLQWIPLVGVLMMLMLAPFWSAILINLGFIGIGAEVLFGRINPVWMLAPLVWFGGYATLAYRSHSEVDVARSDLTKANSGPALSFNPIQDSLVIDMTSQRLEGAANALVVSYDIPVAYEREAAGGSPLHRAHRLAGYAQCRDMQAALATTPNSQIWVNDLTNEQSLNKKFCSFRAPGEPTGRIFVTTTRTESIERNGLKVDLTHLVVSSPDGTSARRSWATAHPLAWLPLPVIGCYLNSAAGAQSCTAQFWRDRTVIGERDRLGNSAHQLVASALALKKATPEARLASLPMHPAPRAETTFANVEQIALKKVDDMLQGGRQPYTMFDVEPLRRNPALLSDRADRMTDFYTANVNRRDTGKIVPEALEVAFEILPEKDFRRIAPRLVQTLSQRPSEECDFGPHVVLARIGLLAGQAMPALDAQARKSARTYCLALLKAICYAGTAASHHTEGVQKVLRESSNSTLQIMAHRALLRLGRRDLAEGVIGQKRRMEKIFVQQLASITPNSPPKVCD